MTTKTIIFVPGKNPKPPAKQHRDLLWRTLQEGVRRANPEVGQAFIEQQKQFHLVAWNSLYYHESKDISRDLPWIDKLIHEHGPSQDDIAQAQHWHRKLDRFLFNIADHMHFIIRFLPKPVHDTIYETNRYFQNKDNIACEIRELLKQELRPLLNQSQKVLLIGHSLGSVIAYDTLWEFSHEETVKDKVDLFLTLGSPLGMNYVQRRLQGYDLRNSKRFPTCIRHWANVASVGDVTALDREFHNDFGEMTKLGLLESLNDHCQGIFNFYHNEEGLNCHRSYGYLVNPAVGEIIADWWRQN